MVSLKLYALAGVQLLHAAVASPAPAPAPAPAPTPGPDLSTLQQTNRVVQVEGGALPPGPIAYSQALAKHRKPIPTQVKIAASSAASTQTAKVQATDLPFDQAYFVNVTVGKVKMLLNFDTGSSDLWVFSTAMPAAQRGSHKLYGLGGTQASGETWNIRYGDGSGASGIVYADKVVIGGVTASVQAVEAATSVSSSFTTGLQDGLVGLGFDEGNTCAPFQCYTFMHQVSAQMPQPLFTATLRHGKPGEYDFGFIDKTKYTGPLTYVTLTDASGAGYWEFTSGGYSLNGGAKIARNMDSIADTGTSLALVDQAVVNAYYAKVPGSQFSSTYGAMIFPCANNASLPTLGFWMSNTVHTMPSAYGIYGPLSSPAGYCYGGVQSNQGGISILGDVWLKSQFVVFDYNQGGSTARIGFAQQAGVPI